MIPRFPRLIKSIEIFLRLSIALCITFSSVAVGQESLNMAQIGGASGGTNVVRRVGNLVYVGAGSQLLILRVGNSGGLSREGFIRVPDQIQSIAVSGNIAYLALGDAGVQLVDITVSSLPSKRGIEPTPGFATDIVVEGGHAYVADLFEGLQIINLSNPDAPVLIGTLRMPDQAMGVGVVNGVVYVAAGRSGLRVIDASDSANPEELTFVEIPGVARRVRIVSDRAYVAAGEGGLRILDMTIPTNPVEVGAYESSGLAWDVAIDNIRAYLVDLDVGLRVISVSDSVNPVEIAFDNTIGRPYAVTGADEQIFLTDGNSQVSFLLLNPAMNALSKVSEWRTLGEVQDLVVSGSVTTGLTLYVAAGDSGLRILTAGGTEPEINFTEIGSFLTDGAAERVHVVGNRAYIADGNLEIIDILDTTAPESEGRYETPGHARSLDVDGNIAYIADDFAGVQIVDVTDPSVPSLLANLDTLGAAQDIVVINQLAYVADGGGGLLVIDVSDSANPAVIGALGGGDFARRLTIRGQVAYIADGFQGLRIVDIHNPSDLREIGRFDTPAFAQAVTVDGHLAYVADANQGVRMIDISDPANLLEVGFFDTLGSAFGLVRNGDRIYVADDANGVVVLEHTLTSPVPPVITEVTPRSSLSGQQIPITIRGENFQFGATVTIGGIPATNISVPLSTQISAATPQGNLGSADIVVINPNGQVGTLPAGFTYLPAQPQITVVPSQLLGLLFSITNLAIEADLNSEMNSLDLRQAFADNGVQLSQNAIVSIVSSNNQWLITNDSRTRYIIRREGNQLNVYPDDLDFGTVLLGANVPRSLDMQIQNTGDADLSIFSVEVPSADFTVTDLSNGRNLLLITPTNQLLIVPGETRLITVTFQPQAIFALDDFLTISSTDPTFFPTRIPMSATVIGEAETFTVSGVGRHVMEVNGQITDEEPLRTGRTVRVIDQTTLRFSVETVFQTDLDNASISGSISTGLRGRFATNGVTLSQSATVDGQSPLWLVSNVSPVQYHIVRSAEDELNIYNTIFSVDGTEAPVPTQNSYSVTFQKFPGDDPIVLLDDAIFVEVSFNGDRRGLTAQFVGEADIANRGMQVDFTIPFPRPTITQISPVVGGGNTPIQIEGTDFREGATVQIGLKEATEVQLISSTVSGNVTSTAISALTPTHGPGNQNVTVTNPDGQSVPVPAVYTYGEVTRIVVEPVRLGEETRLKASGFNGEFPITLTGNLTWGPASSPFGDLALNGVFTARQLGVTTLSVTSSNNSFDPDTLTVALTITGGAPSDLTLTANPPIITADGVATSEIIVDVRDAQNNPVVNEPIELEATSGTFSTVADQGDGTYRTTYTASTQVGVVMITATASSGAMGDTTIELRPVAASLTINPAEDELVANGLPQTTALTITVIDTAGNPAPDKSVAISANLGQLSEIVDARDGTYTATYTVTTTTTGKVTISASTEHDVAASTQIDLVAGPVTGVTLRLLDDQLLADGEATTELLINLTDAFNNPAVDESLQFDLRPFSNDQQGEADVGLVQDIIDQGDGSYIATYLAGTRIGALIIRVSVDETFDEKTITLIVGPPDSVVWDANPSEPIADGVTIVGITLTVTDTVGHPLSGLAVFLNADRGNIATTATPQGGGIYTTTYVPDTVVLPVTIAATASDGQSSASSSFELPLKHGPPSPSASTIEIEKAPNSTQDVTPPADGVAPVEVTATILDEHNNPISGASATIVASGTGNTVTPPTQVTDENGAATVAIRSTVPGRKLITAAVTLPSISGQIELQAHPIVRFNSAFISRITFLDPPQELTANGKSIPPFDFVARNEEEQPISEAEIAMTAARMTATAGSISPRAQSLGNGRYRVIYFTPLEVPPEDDIVTITATPENGESESIQVKLLPGVVSLEDSLVEAEPAEVLADGVSTATITVTVRDRFQNPIPNRSVRIAATGEGVEITQPTELTDENGQTRGEIRSTVPGQKTILADDNTEPEVSRPLLSNPVVTFLPRTPVSLTIVPDDSSLPADGESRTTVRIRVLDAVGNPIEAGDVQLTASVGVISSTAINLGDGTYTATYTAGNLPQSVAITASTTGGLTRTGGLTLERIDFSPPTLEAFTVKSTSIELMFNEAVVGGNQENWTVDSEPVSSFVGAGTNYLITFAMPKPSDATPVVRYSGSVIADLSGNRLPDNTVVIAQDGILPLYDAKVAGANAIRITFSEPVSSPTFTTAAWFVAVEDTVFAPVQFSQIDAAGLIWELAVDPAFQGGESPVLRYASAIGDLVDKGGNPPPTDPVTAQTNNAPALLLTDVGGNPLRGDPVPLPVREGETIEITVTGEDQEGEVLTFTREGVGSWKGTNAATIPNPQAPIEFIYTPPFDTASAADIDGVVQTATIFITDGRFTASQRLEFTVSHESQATQISVAANPDRLLADGQGESRIAVTVTDTQGQPVTDEIVRLLVTPQQVGVIIGTINPAAVDQGAGIYTATYTVSESVGSVVITAIASNAVSGETQIIQQPGEPATATLASDVTALFADGQSRANLSVAVFDAKNRPIDDVGIRFISPATGNISELISQGNGVHTAIYTAGTIAADLESAEITIDVLVEQSANRVLRSAITLTLIQPNRPPQLIVQDGAGNLINDENSTFGLVEGEEISFSLEANDLDGDAITLSLEGQPPGATFDSVDGFQWQTDTNTVRGFEGTKAFQIRFVATDGQGGATVQAILITVQHVSLAARFAVMTANPDSLEAGALAVATVTMVLTDSQGVHIPEERIELTATEGQVFEVIDNGLGIYTATYLPPTKAGTVQLTARVANTDVSAVLDLIIRPARLTEVEISAEPPIPQFLRAGETVLFQAAGGDRFQNVIDFSSDQTNWEVAGEIGGIDENGVFVATTVGTGHVEVIVNDPIVGEVRQMSEEITVIPGELAQLRITPVVQQIRIGESQVFEATGSDIFDNTVEIPGEEVSWEVIGGIGRFIEAQDISPNAQEFEPTTLGTGQIRATFGKIQSTTPAITVVVGAAATITVTPSEGLNLTAGETQQFQAIARDVRGNEVPLSNTAARWQVLGSQIGTVTPDGLFTATTPGFGQVEISVDNVFGESGLIVVRAGPLAKLAISPASLRLTAGETQQFTVIGQDVAGNHVSVGTVKWEVLGELGEISEDGVFTAQHAGIGQIRVVAESEPGISITQHSGQITVSPGQLLKIQITPETNLILGVDESLPFIATGVDAFGNVVLLSDLVWEVIGGIGSINQLGDFTATREGVGRIRAASGGIVNESGEIVIVPPYRLLLADIAAGREQEITLQIAIQPSASANPQTSIFAEIQLRYPANLLDFVRLEQNPSIQLVGAVEQAEDLVVLPFQFQPVIEPQPAPTFLRLTFVVTPDAPTDGTGVMELESVRFLDTGGNNVPVRTDQSRFAVLPDVTVVLDVATIAPGASTTLSLSLFREFSRLVIQGFRGVIQIGSDPAVINVTAIQPTPEFEPFVSVSDPVPGTIALALGGIPDQAGLESGVQIADLFNWLPLQHRMCASRSPFRQVSAQRKISHLALSRSRGRSPYWIIVRQPGKFRLMQERILPRIRMWS